MFFNWVQYILKQSKLEKCTGMEHIQVLQKHLDDHQKGKFFCAYYDNSFYWGKCLHMFPHDLDSKVDEVDFSFMHLKYDGLWDWPKKEDEKQVASKFVFHGPCMPTQRTKQGFRFAEEEAAIKEYKLYKNNIKKMQQ